MIFSRIDTGWLRGVINAAQMLNVLWRGNEDFRFQNCEWWGSVFGPVSVFELGLDRRLGWLRKFGRGSLLFLSVGFIAGCAAAPGEAANNERLAKAIAMFEQRCKVAGEKIRHVVSDVEGIYVLKRRPEKINFSDQFELDDPYGSDLSGDGYIQSFLRGSYQFDKTEDLSSGPPRLGYFYVEAVDPLDGRRYRYMGKVVEPWQTDKSYLQGYKKYILNKIPSEGPAPRYGVTYDDISTPQERSYWIAGSSLKVIDLKNGELIAERIGYMIDLGQGNTAGGRSPWLLAANNACPEFGREFKGRKVGGGHAFGLQPRQAQDFVEKVLKPKLK